MGHLFLLRDKRNDRDPGDKKSRRDWWEWRKSHDSILDKLEDRQLERHRRLIKSLRNPACYDHPADDVSVRETHISSVLLTGPFAYKIKKPVQFDFLDFSSLEKREYYCRQELELNRRLCPDLYREVLPIGGSCDSPVLDQGKNVIEYAVKMEQFPEENLLSKLAEAGDLNRRLIDTLCDEIVDFQDRVDSSPPVEVGTFGEIKNEAMNNFEPFEEKMSQEDLRYWIKPVKEWTAKELSHLRNFLRQRRETGYVRHGHGDMHLGNMVQIDDQVQIFDCVEFNENFRWIDVINELAFLLMDLRHRNHHQLANRLRNRYFSRTGDYEGLKVLNVYRMYRAMVRAKVNILDGARTEALEYLETAHDFLDRSGPILIITHGMSGSGKTTFTDRILESLGALRVRSDIERKRLADIPLTETPSESQKDQVYSPEMTEKTYKRLGHLAEIIIQAGYPAIVDATFLKQRYRKKIAKLADELGVKFRIVNFDFEEEILRKRLRQRNERQDVISDADVNILETQRNAAEPLDETEREKSLKLNEETKEHSVVNRLMRLSEGNQEEK